MLSSVPDIRAVLGNFLVVYAHADYFYVRCPVVLL